MLTIKIKQDIILDDDVVGPIQQKLANAVVAVLTTDANVTATDGIEVEITTIRPHEAVETYIGRAD